MLHWSRKRLHLISTTLIAAFAGLWLAGVCAAAPVACDSPCMKGCPPSDITMSCDHVVASPSLSASTASIIDFSAAPVVLDTVPVGDVATDVACLPPPAWQATRPPATPLYLEHLALLN